MLGNCKAKAGRKIIEWVFYGSSALKARKKRNAPFDRKGEEGLGRKVGGDTLFLFHDGKSRRDETKVLREMGRKKIFY